MLFMVNRELMRLHLIINTILSSLEMMNIIFNIKSKIQFMKQYRKNMVHKEVVFIANHLNINILIMLIILFKQQIIMKTLIHMKNIKNTIITKL